MKNKIILLFILLFFKCSAESEATIQDRKDTLLFAILAKEQECGVRPEFPIISLNKKDTPPEYGTRACTVAILQASCPFTSYPLVCLEFYKYDVPNSGPRLNSIQLNLNK
jgi:hypothetical protein